LHIVTSHISVPLTNEMTNPAEHSHLVRAILETVKHVDRLLPTLLKRASRDRSAQVHSYCSKSSDDCMGSPRVRCPVLVI